MPHNSETHTVVLVNFHDAFDLRESPNSGVRYAEAYPTGRCIIRRTDTEPQPDA